MRTNKTVEYQILTPIYEAARDRAEDQDRALYVVARAILLNISRAAAPSEDGVAHPATRPAGAETRRIRFSVTPHEHQEIKSRIRSSGMSMTAALESGLEEYALTGTY